jgi:hypothetical protein
MMDTKRLAVSALAAILAIGGIGSILVNNRPQPVDAVELDDRDPAIRRLDDDANELVAVDDDDAAPKGDGDRTRGNDGTSGGANTGDGDRTRGNDGTGGGNNTGDGDRTRGNDGTGGGNNTGDGDRTAGNDGTGGGNNTAVNSNSGGHTGGGATTG